MIKLKTIPPMRCDDGCGDCCGIVPCSESEYQSVLRYAKRKGLVPVVQDLTCPWFQNGKCSVYPARPLLCRLFGHIIGMPCPKGYGSPIDEREAARMVRAAGYETRPGVNRMLHHALVDMGIVSDLRPVLRLPPSSTTLVSFKIRHPEWEEEPTP